MAGLIDARVRVKEKQRRIRPLHPGRVGTVVGSSYEMYGQFSDATTLWYVKLDPAGEQPGTEAAFYGDELEVVLWPDEMGGAR